MKSIIDRFSEARRAAIGMIFALFLLPLALFVAIAIDYSFFTEARSQIQLAADAAVTHAIRAAASTYALEINQDIPVATATADAKTAGDAAGQAWFVAQLGALPTAYIPPGVVQDNENPYIDVEATTNPTGFSAVANYQGNYPPFFDALGGGTNGPGAGPHLFSSTSYWYIKGSSSAQTAYSYVEILMMLDTSGSMLLGATPTDIQTMNYGTMCMPTSGPSAVLDLLGDPGPFSQAYDYLDQDGNQIYPTSALTLNATNGVCNKSTGKGVPSYQQPAFAGNTGQYAGSYLGTPCAFACHTDGTMDTDGYTDDIYGQDRRLGVTLRIDKVFQATEQVLQSMIASESVSDQYSVGLYQFNKDVSPLTSATIGDTAGGDASAEATTNLSGVLQAVQSIDYSYKPENLFPPVDTTDAGETNFGTSMNDLYSGNYKEGTPPAAASALTPAGSGVCQTAGTAGCTGPLKDLFIGTDGMEDETGVRVMGEMTGAKVENGTSTSKLAPICKQFKTAGYTVYVMLIDYYPVPIDTYYIAYDASPTDAYLNDDYNTLANTTVRNMTLGLNVTGAATPLNASYPDDSPDDTGLRACASTPSDFFEATDSQQIATEMTEMLKSALATSIRVTN
jgi:hypothetical protein